MLLNEEDALPTLPGQFSTFNSRVGMTGNDKAYWVGGISTVQGGSTQNYVLFLGSSSNPVLMGGDAIGGVPDLLRVGSSIDFDTRFSALGTSYITVGTMDSATAIDKLVIIDGAAMTAGGSVVREGTVVPPAIGGLPGELWANFDFLGITESGNTLVTGDTGGATATDEFIMVDGQIVMREGAIIGDYTVSGSIEGAYLNEDGDWAAIWDVDDELDVNLEALMLNGKILLLEGEPVDWNNDGVIDAGDNGGVVDNFTGITALTMGDRIDGFVDLYFTADIDFAGTVLEGFFKMSVSVGCPPECSSDLDGDCDVDFDDLNLLLAAYGSSDGRRPRRRRRYRFRRSEPVAGAVRERLQLTRSVPHPEQWGALRGLTGRRIWNAQIDAAGALCSRGVDFVLWLTVRLGRTYADNGAITALRLSDCAASSPTGPAWGV